MDLNLLQLYERHCLPFIEAFLPRLVGQPRTLVTDEDRYRRHVIDPAWATLPMPLRVRGRAQLRWDEFHRALRKEVFLAKEGNLSLRSDAHERLAVLARRLFGGDTAAARTPAPVVATPVLPAQPLTAVPVAKAVSAAAAVGEAVPVLDPVGKPPGKKRRTAVEAVPQAPLPAVPDLAIGIDLGTTYSVVAHLDAHGRPWSIPNAGGDLLTPSVVLFEEGGAIVGKEAVLASAMEPDKIADCVKRDMGSKAYRKQINGEYLPPEVISSLILRSLKADAERKLGPVKKAVITVPAYFDEGRRRATMDAGKLAGLEVLDIINEPTAAAIAFGYQLGFLDRSGKAAAEQPLRVLVYDLGGGTFDVTIVEIQGSSFKALATDGDVCLGGKDWDEKLIEIAAEQFRRQYREDPRDNPVSLQELWIAAETAKKTLTERPKAAIYVNHLGSRMKVEVTREQFEEATAALLGRTRTTTEIVVRQAGLGWTNIDKVLLVGGSTRMPMVIRALQELTGKPPERSVSADEAVAHGAALYADLLLQGQGKSKTPPRFAITNVNSHSLGILGVDQTTQRRRNQILIPKNTPLPHTATKVFPTSKAGQKTVVIRILEGESARPDACTEVGTCTIRDLPPELPAGWPVQISYTYEANGRLHIAAKLKGHKAGVKTDFFRDNSLSDNELALWIEYVAEESKRLA